MGGKSVETGIEDEHGTVAFAVEVQRHTVQVHPQSVRGLKSTMSDNEESESDD